MNFFDKDFDINNFDYDDHITNIINIAKSIKYGEITILTGSNCVGKSLIRKLLPNSVKEVKVAQISQEKRTRPSEDFYALRSLALDDPDTATSMNSYFLLKSLFRTENRYLILDEPEIGMGKALIKSLAEKINENVQIMKDENKFHGILIITHSDILVKNLNKDSFINIDGLSENDWLNFDYDSLDIDIDKVFNFGGKLNSAIFKRINNK